MKRTLFSLLFLISFLAASHQNAYALIFNFGLDFSTVGGVPTKTEVPFFNGDHTAILLDRTDAVDTNDRLDFEFLVRDKLPNSFMIQKVELFIDARGLAHANNERGVLRILSPQETLGDLNSLNAGPNFVPLAGGGRAVSDVTLGPDTDDVDNSFFTIPSSRYSDLTTAILAFRIVARPDAKFRVDGVNLQITGIDPSSAVVPEPSAMILMLVGLGVVSGLSFLRRQ